MKSLILPTLAFTLFSAGALAQKARTFAITSNEKGGYVWNAVREIDLSTGEAIKTHFDQSSKNIEIVADDLKSAANFRGGRPHHMYRMSPMADGVAAAAFDERHNRLYYTCMRGMQLRYFDFNDNTTKVVYKQDKNLFDGSRFNEANVITRMSFASDGSGYALTNDGSHLIKFTTDQKATITDLGPLVDGKKNGTVSIHAQCSSWGGDMVGDAYGNLYVITYKNYIFKVNPKTRVADLVGQVKGLPAQFTSNGMAVNNDGEVVVSCATLADVYYKVNISTLQATALQKSGGLVYNASDLANSNLLFKNNAVSAPLFTELKGNNALSVYPNPVKGKTFTMQFDKLPAGKYNLVLTDASGRSVLSRSLNINTLGQVERINLPQASSSGMYLIKLTGQNRSIAYSDKIVVE